MAGIELAGVAKAYGAHKVLPGVNLRVEDGECFTLLGPSGCGKTVLLRLVAGFEQPDAGRIAIGGRIVSDPAADVFLQPQSRRIGVVFQDYAVWPHMTVLDNVAYPLKIAGLPKTEILSRTMAAVEQVNLSGMERRMPSQLSGGQQQRVALARALVASPEVMLLDEPLSNLDANLREEMRFEIKELQASAGITILYVTHDQEIALALADRMAVMDRAGRIRQVGPPREIFERPADAYVFDFMGVANFVPVRRVDGRAVVEGGPDTGLAWPDDPRLGERAYLGLRPSDLEPTREAGAVPAVVRRSHLLGADIDLRLDLGATPVRALQDTREAMDKGLVFAEGEGCGLTLTEPLWFDAASVEELAR